MCCKDWKKLHPEKEDCFENKTSATEKGKTFRIECKDRTEQFCRIHVDGCFIIDNNSSKCDYIFVRCKNEDIYYVELKGQNIEKAYEQIVMTIQQHFPSPPEKNYGFIIASRITTASNRLIAMKKQEFKKYGKELTVKSITHTHQV